MSDQRDRYKNLFSLEGKVAVVTGAYGYLGSEIARSLAGFGAHVQLIGRNEEKLIDLLKQNRSIFDINSEYYVCDVTHDQEFKTVVDTIRKKHKTIDILVNNAYGKQYETFEDLTKEKWNNALEHTLTQYFTCIQAVSPIMLKAQQGSIINIASIYSFLGTDQRIFKPLGRKSPIHYSVSKGGILQMTKYLAMLWAEKNIRVNAISPGHFPPKRGPERPDYMHELTYRIPLGRIGQPADLAGAVVFLASGASSYVTGQNLVVDGGWSVW
jgi:NAD(P)-dependent dehydrogenase (short-subunit alcohol dehydrogenase family)